MQAAKTGLSNKKKLVEEILTSLEPRKSEPIEAQVRLSPSLALYVTFALAIATTLVLSTL